MARVRGATLDGTLLAARDDAVLLEVVGEMRDAAHEAAMVAGADRAVVDLVGDAAAGGERRVGHARVAAVDDDRGAARRADALVDAVRHAVAVGEPADVGHL